MNLSYNIEKTVEVNPGPKRGHMKILVVNDDGIHAEGIKRLCALAKKMGEVYVVAPANQCSAMSHRITVRGDLLVQKQDFEVEGVKAYSVDGTPADCVKVALKYLMPERPDVVFSGINRGYNIGIDVLYSGTVGAAMEARVNGITAFAFSSEYNEVFDAVEEYLIPITEELLREQIGKNEIWNINFPGCNASEIKGIKKDVRAAQQEFYEDNFIKCDNPDGSFVLSAMGRPTEKAEKDTDIDLLWKRYITVQKIRNMILEP